MAGLTLVAPVLHAEDITTETLPMAYFYRPLGATGKAALPVFGLQLTRASVSRQGGVNLFSNERPAILDFQIKNGEVNAFTVNGLNTLDKQTVVYADGSTGTETSINWNVVVPAVLVGGFIVYKATDDDDGDDECTGFGCGGGSL